MLINTGNISRKVLSKVLRSFVKNFERPQLYDLISATDMNSMEVAILFYSYLNDKTDDFLEANDFSRDEIKLGMENVADNFGLNSIAKMFLTDF